MSVSPLDKPCQLNTQDCLRAWDSCQFLTYVKLLIESSQQPKEAGAVGILLPAQKVHMWDLNPEQPYY